MGKSEELVTPYWHDWWLFHPDKELSEFFPPPCRAPLDMNDTLVMLRCMKSPRHFDKILISVCWKGNDVPHVVFLGSFRQHCCWIGEKMWCLWLWQLGGYMRESKGSSRGGVGKTFSSMSCVSKRRRYFIFHLSAEAASLVCLAEPAGECFDVRCPATWCWRKNGWSDTALYMS